ncbi:hypothetical protein [Synechococcus sp. M16CYN]|uniref:hypothetical protein n=1 Tax=Synechococcus sp. M16CYN TaxID=3103139 RepID=UPI003340E1AE
MQASASLLKNIYCRYALLLRENDKSNHWNLSNPPLLLRKRSSSWLRITDNTEDQYPLHSLN